MAKAIIDLVCTICGLGFTHEKNGFGKRARADEYEAWAKDAITTCPECYKKAKAAEAKKTEQKAKKSAIMKRAWVIYRELEGGDRRARLSIAMKQAWAETKGDNLVALEGTEKQIAWATSIRQKAISKVLPHLKNKAVEKFTNALNAKSKAYWWIDNRYDLNSKYTDHDTIRAIHALIING